RPRLVVRIGMQALGASKHAGERLDSHAGEVVQRLLRRERDTGRLGVEAHPRRALVLGSDFFFQAEDGIRAATVTGVQTCALPISWSRISPAMGTPSDRTRIRRAHRRGDP